MFLVGLFVLAYDPRSLIPRVEGNVEIRVSDQGRERLGRNSCHSREGGSLLPKVGDAVPNKN